MRVIVAGGHGKIGRRLLRLLAEDGHHGVGLIRNPDHAADIEADGAEPLVLDLEQEDDATEHVRGADAIVFAAGAGPGSGPERKRTVDYGAAVKLADAAERAGVRRFVIVSSIGAHNPDGGGETMGPYLQAKADADAHVAAGGLDWTIVRPGSLSDDPGSGAITATTDQSARGPVTRDDVAATLLAVLEDDSTVGKTFVLLGGDQPIAEALRAL